MVDIDAAVGFVVAHGDRVDRARMSFLRSGVSPPDDILAGVEVGQAASGGWPAQWAGDIASIDATCFRLAELDDLDGLRRPSARRALDWLAAGQRVGGFWEEDQALASHAPPWARPGDPEARFYLTSNAAFWLAAAGTAPSALDRAARAIVDSIHADGTWPGFLVSGWLAAAVLHATDRLADSVRIFVALADRVPEMSAADAAWMTASLRRVGVSPDNSLLAAARERLHQTQRRDGAWPSDDAPALDVHTTLTALRGLLTKVDS